jgi:glycyl-tRNA synthetase (class II)
VKLAAEKPLSEPKVIDVVEVQTDKSVIGKTFKQNAKLITGYFEKLTADQINDLEKLLNSNDGQEEIIF